MRELHNRNAGALGRRDGRSVFCWCPRRGFELLEYENNFWKLLRNRRLHHPIRSSGNVENWCRISKPRLGWQDAEQIRTTNSLPKRLFYPRNASISFLKLNNSDGCLYLLPFGILLGKRPGKGQNLQGRVRETSRRGPRSNCHRDWWEGNVEKVRTCCTWRW